MSNPTSEPQDFNSRLPPHIPGIDETFGAVLVGTAIALTVYVFSLLQAFRYFELYRTDTRFLRGLVCTTLALDLVHTVLAIDACCWHLVTNHSHLDGLRRNYWSFQSFNCVNVAIMLVCQLFYARRMHRVLGPRYRWLTLVVAISMVSTILSAASLTFESVRSTDILAVKKINWTLAWLYGSAMATDVTLTSALVIKLLKSRTGWKHTDSIIRSIVAYTISCGLLFTVTAAICFLFATIQSGNLIYIGISNIGAKVYVFSTITAIKSRKNFSIRMMEDAALGSTFTTSPTQTCRSQVRPSVGNLSALEFAPPAVVTSISTRASSIITSTARPKEDSEPG